MAAGNLIDRRTGELRQAQIFVAVMGTSTYTYAEATSTQGLEGWIESNTRMLVFFGGVPELLIPDNLRSATTNVWRYTYSGVETVAEHLYEYAVWRHAKVAPEYHVQFLGRYFSVPPSLVGQKVDLRITGKVVEVLCRGKRVASH